MTVYIDKNIDSIVIHFNHMSEICILILNIAYNSKNPTNKGSDRMMHLNTFISVTER